MRLTRSSASPKRRVLELSRTQREGEIMDRIIEEESGTYAPRRAHPHNGYYAGDFSAVAFRQPDLRTLLALTRATTGPTPRSSAGTGLSRISQSMELLAVPPLR
jgi:hypothetical protein